MIYRYKDGNQEHFIDFDKIIYMRAVYGTFDNDPKLTLYIDKDDGKTIQISAMVKYTEDGISDYPLDKLKKIANSWMRHKNNDMMTVEREIQRRDGTEYIIEKISGSKKQVISG